MQPASLLVAMQCSPAVYTAWRCPPVSRERSETRSGQSAGHKLSNYGKGQSRGTGTLKNALLVPSVQTRHVMSVGKEKLLNGKEYTRF